MSVILQLTGNLQRSASTLLVQIAYSIILAVSLNLVVGFLGELSLGHAGFMCVGAYLGGYIAIQLSMLSAASFWCSSSACSPAA